MSKAKVDQELTRQLDASAGAEPVSASFSFESAATRAIVSPEETERRVHDLLKKVQGEVGDAPSHFRVHKNIGSFSVTATPEFIRKLCEQKGIVTATANRQPGEMLIKPVSAEPVPEPSPETPSSSRHRGKS
jgi:hypothetical protein